MLETLKHLDRERAGDVIAAAALATSPGSAGEQSVDADLAQKLLKEIRVHLHLSEVDDSSKARSKIDDFLSKAYDEVVLSPDRMSAALLRAGNSGLLSPGAYDVIQPVHFEQKFRPLEAPKKLVRDAVTHPDLFQHVMTERALPEERDLFTLSLKWIGAGKKAHWFLVQTLRTGTSQEVQSAWHVFPDLVNLSEATMPIDVLRAFADSFGLPIRIGFQASKFIHGVLLPRNPVTGEMTVTVEMPTVPNSFGTYSYQKMEDPTVFGVGLAYCIDVNSYAAELKKHI